MAVEEVGPLGSLDEYLSTGIDRRAEAGICDFQLSSKRYASFTGAELVARLYDKAFPAVLCTRWEKAQLYNFTLLRRWIPVLLAPSELNEETFVQGIDACMYELSGNFRSVRRPWRTQVHFLQMDEDNQDAVYAEVPGWEVDEVIKLNVAMLPEPLRTRDLEDYRCHAFANLGALSSEELYLCDWLLE